MPSSRIVATAALCAVASSCALATPAGAHSGLSLRPAGPSVHADRFTAGADKRLAGAAERARLRGLGDDAGSFDRPQLAAAWCGRATGRDDAANASTGSGPAIKAVYAYPADMPNRFEAYADLVQDDVRTVAGYMDDFTGGRRTLRFDAGTACGPEYVDIATVALPRPRAGYLTGTLRERYQRVQNDVRAGLGTLPYASHLLVYADTLSSGDTTVGVAGLWDDDRSGAGNRHNQGGLAAVILGNSTAGWANPQFAWGSARQTSVLHELTHVLGGVQDSAPHATGDGHCTEPGDIMCEQARAGGACPGGAAAYDCGRDDYFSPAPAPGSYLSRHWNVYDSSFLCDLDACIRPGGNRAPRPAMVVREADGRPTEQPASGAQVTLDGTPSSDAEGAVQSWAWDVGADGDVDATGATAPYTFAGEGEIAVRLVVRDAGGAPNAVTRTLRIGPPPAAAPGRQPPGDLRARAGEPLAPYPRAQVAAQLRRALRDGTRRLRRLSPARLRSTGLAVRYRSPAAGILSAEIRAGRRPVAAAQRSARAGRRLTLRVRPSRRSARWLRAHPRTRLRLVLFFDAAR